MAFQTPIKVQSAHACWCRSYSDLAEGTQAICGHLRAGGGTGPPRRRCAGRGALSGPSDTRICSRIREKAISSVAGLPGGTSLKPPTEGVQVRGGSNPATQPEVGAASPWLEPGPPPGRLEVDLTSGRFDGDGITARTGAEPMPVRHLLRHRGHRFPART